MISIKLDNSTRLAKSKMIQISSIRACNAFHCYLEKSMFCQVMLNIMIDKDVDVNLLFKFVNKEFLFKKVELLEL